jgi:hypothetical protein
MRILPNNNDILSGRFVMQPFQRRDGNLYHLRNCAASSDNCFEKNLYKNNINTLMSVKT